MERRAGYVLMRRLRGRLRGLPRGQGVEQHGGRMGTQVLGMVSIFITSLWGMWQNMQIGFPY